MGSKHRSEQAESQHEAFSGVVAQPEQILSLLKIFVYGTLKPGQATYQVYCSGKAIDARAAIAQGQLFSLPAGYPAMTLGEGQVRGFVLLFKDEAILSELDDYEGYQVGRSPQRNLYERHQVETFDPTGRLFGFAWAYLMSPEKVHHLKGTLLPEGQWN